MKGETISGHISLETETVCYLFKLLSYNVPEVLLSCVTMDIDLWTCCSFGFQQKVGYGYLR